MKTYDRPNAPCQGCGFPIRNDMATCNAAVRDFYCIVCDPNGRRENIMLRTEGRERFDLENANHA